MAKFNKALLAFAMGLMFACPQNVEAADLPEGGNPEKHETVATENFSTEYDFSQSDETTSVLVETERESIIRHKSKSLAFSHFTWGAEAGASIDMTSNDMSTIDADVYLGFKNSFIKVAGAGVGIHRSIHNGNNFIPIYGVFRTSFRSKPSLCFMNVQAGCSLNAISDSKTFTNFICNLGVGFNLTQSRTAKSYILVSGGYSHYCQHHREQIMVNTNHIFSASLAIGVSF